LLGGVVFGCRNRGEGGRTAFPSSNPSVSTPGPPPGGAYGSGRARLVTLNSAGIGGRDSVAASPLANPPRNIGTGRHRERQVARSRPFPVVGVDHRSGRAGSRSSSRFDQKLSIRPSTSAMRCVRPVEILLMMGIRQAPLQSPAQHVARLGHVALGGVDNRGRVDHAVSARPPLRSRVAGVSPMFDVQPRYSIAVCFRQNGDALSLSWVHRAMSGRPPPGVSRPRRRWSWRRHTVGLAVVDVGDDRHVSHVLTPPFLPP